MPGVELQRLGTKLEFEEEDNRRETTLDLGALVAAEAPNVLRQESSNAKEKMRDDGLLAHFFIIAGFELTVYRWAAVFQLALVSLSLGFDIAILLIPTEGSSTWSVFFLVAFVSNCVFLVDVLVRLFLGSSPAAWVVLLSVGSCIKEPHFLPACIQRYLASLYGALCVAALVLRFFQESLAVVVISACLWVLVLLFVVGICPITMLYGLLLQKGVISFSTKMRNFLINHSQNVCRFSSCGLIAYVETPESHDAPRVW